jgi:hypothetical protein
VPLSGFVNNEEIVNYMLRYELDSPETLNVVVRLSALSGDPNLYVKECLTND